MMPTSNDRMSRILFAAATLVAATALLVFALAYAGLLGNRGDREGGSAGDTTAEPARPQGESGASTATLSVSKNPIATSPAHVTTSSAASSAEVPTLSGASAITSPATAPPSDLATPSATVPVGSPVAVGPTARLSPTPGPSPTVGELPPAIVEDWNRFDDTAALLDAFSVNEGWADNTINLRLISAGTGLGQGKAVTLDFDITAAEPNNYVGFEWDLSDRQDWRKYDALELEIAGEIGDAHSPQTQLVIQWHEISGEVWRHRETLDNALASARLSVPLAPEAWEWADWSEYRDLVMNPETVTRMGVFVGHAGPTTGHLELGTIRVAQR
jgi:hypothetical protein